MKRLRRSLRSAYTSRVRTSAGRAAITGFGVVAATHLVCQLLDPGSVLSDATQILLMPALAATLLAGTAKRDRLVRLVLVALGASWLGDTVPRFLAGDAGFLAMVGCFLVAQVCYIAAFLPMRAASVPWQEWRGRWPYLVAFAGLVGWCLPGAGALAPPVIVYGAALTAMAMLSAGVSVTAGVGGAVFMASDGLIALHAFAGVTLPAHDFWVMLTYLIGQALIVAAVIEREPRSAAEQPAGRPSRGAVSGAGGH